MFERHGLPAPAIWAGPGACERDAVQQAGESVLALLGDYLQQPERWPLLGGSERLKQLAAEPASVAQGGNPLPAVLDEAIALMQEGLCNVAHPSYFGYISPRPHPATVLGDFLGSALNQTPGAWRAGPAATAIEVQVLHWLRELFGLPAVEGALPGGIFTGGGTLANLIALKLARDQLLGKHVQIEGLDPRGLRIYMSCEGHFSVCKALDTLGFGRNALVQIDTDRFGALDIEQLRERLITDVAEGLRPLCLIGTAGTTASGAIDPLEELAELAAEYAAWFHVDGASGLAMAALPEPRRAMAGIERADSITFDPCKWMFASFGVGCLLVRNGERLGESFWSGGHYWEELGELDTFKMNLYGTRQFRSLGLWCLLQHLGAQGYRDALQGMLDCAGRLKELLGADPRYQLLPQQEYMPLVAFRLAGHTDAHGDALTAELVRHCQDSGAAYPTRLDWRGRVYMRIAISNYATNPEHIERFKHLLDELLPAVECAIPEGERSC
ncbi:pyridoxal phosphate-dependent decarboxylase family protein [Pseudomonas sp. NCHU5208]|uniref:pyridoxal phosphate-dependent decarboxylase family protein n=1 Tax=unclassified Pseudomonas TaxID=196821 RepID=UPI003F95496D